MTTFRLPDLGEGLTESEIVSWQVAEGDDVELNQVLAEVETAKATVELPSPYAGRIAKLHAGEGQTIAVGAPLIDFDLADSPANGNGAAKADTATAGADDDAAAGADQSPVASSAAVANGEATGSAVQEVDAPPEASEAAAAPERQSVLVGYGPKVDGGKRPQRRARTFETTPFTGRSDAEAKRETPKAMPPVRALATRLGVDLREVRGTGADGLILRSDVEAAAGTHDRSAPSDRPTGQDDTPQPSAPDAPAVTGSRESTFVPVSGLRKHTAQAMTDSAFSAPHAAVFSTVDVTATMDLVRRGKARSTSAPSFLALASRAVMLAARRTPAANARFDAEAGQIEYYGSLNLGIAVATDRGLVVPGIVDADLLDARTLTEQIATQAAKAREGSLSLPELTNSTLTITNVGVFGVDGGIPILNPGQSVIVALGAVSRRPWEFEGEVALREVVHVSISFDHRVLDGAEASTFLTDITDVLSEPALALTR